MPRPAIIHLKRPTRKLCGANPRARRATSPSLFGLSPSGVCTARGVTTSAVSSYLTISPLPADRSRPAVYFLLHFPWNRSRWALPTTLPCGVRTFLDPAAKRPHMGRDCDLHWKGGLYLGRGGTEAPRK